MTDPIYSTSRVGNRWYGWVQWVSDRGEPWTVTVWRWPFRWMALIAASRLELHTSYHGPDIIYKCLDCGCTTVHFLELQGF